ncbi:MAG: hypothetical protein E7Z89_08570 [Cyanobacteria bacterium SIG28]|nr:hypothetical protein [Cyanobacteria bacterium SIG28]
MFRDILKTLKINHYVKNLIVVIPLLFSMSFTNPFLWVKVLLIFLAFCAVSSAVYVMNDLIDIKKDLLHPIKKNRAIASGRISKPLAITILLILFSISLFLSALLNLPTLLMIVFYFVLNVFYSLYLKNIAIIDATCIAIGFILRIVAGCFAISVVPSPLVILLTFFTSLFFTFTKRKLELSVAKENARQSLKEYNIEVANQFIVINAILSIAFYFTYVLDPETVQRAGSQYLYLTVIPFTLIIYRLLLLIYTQNIADDPIHFLEKDKSIKYLFVLYFIVLALVLMFLK